MGVLTYLQFVNRVLGRINQTVITDVAGAVNPALIVSQMVNEAQSSIASRENWYTLYTARSFNTVAGTATVALASDFGRCINLTNTTNKTVLAEDYLRTMDEADQGNLLQGNPTHFCVTGSNYLFYPIPSAIYAIRERYWASPTAMSSNSSTSILPYFCDNLILYLALQMMLESLNRFSHADRIKLQFDGEFEIARAQNRKAIDKMNVMTPTSFNNNIVRLPGQYPDRFR